MLKRYLVTSSPTPDEFNNASFQYLIRTANEKGLLLSDWPVWRKYREMRSKTSHAYDQAVALEVVAGMAEFIKEVNYLLDNLKQRGD